MRYKQRLTNKIFTANTNNLAEEVANEWASKFVRELRENRKAWNDKDGMFNVECTVVVEEWEVD